MQSKSSVVENAEVVGVKVKSIKKAGYEDVYCLGSQKNGTMIANGIITSNCDALRYAIYTHFFGKDGPQSSADDLERRYREVRGQHPDLPRFFQDPNAYGF